MPRQAKTVASQRLSRGEWLGSALEAVAKEGGGVLTIDELVQRLGVSRGSFYWHFKDRTDFVRQLVGYWSELFTQEVAKETDQSKGKAEERLISLAEHIVSGRLARYDIAIRAWALHDPVAARGVKKVDEFRLKYVRSLFEDMGFEGEELETRTRTFVVFYSLEPGLFVGISRKEQLRQLILRHRLLTRHTATRRDINTDIEH